MQNLEEKLGKAQDEFAEAYEGLALDERDSYPDIREIIKDILGFIPTPLHKEIYPEYKKYERTADKAVKVAQALAMAYRKENRVTIAELETDYYGMIELLK